MATEFRPTILESTPRPRNLVKAIYSNTPEDLLALANHELAANPAFRKRRLWNLLGAPLAYLFAFAIFARLTGQTLLLVGGVSAAWFHLAWCWRTYHDPARKAVERFLRLRPRSDPLGAHTLILSSEGIADRTEHSRHFVVWDAVTEVAATADHLFVAGARGDVLIIPKRELGDGLFGQVADQLFEHHPTSPPSKPALRSATATPVSTAHLGFLSLALLAVFTVSFLYTTPLRLDLPLPRTAFDQPTPDEIARAKSPAGWCVAYVSEFNFSPAEQSTQVILAFDRRCGSGAVSFSGIHLGLELRWPDATTLEVKHPASAIPRRNANGEIIQCADRKVRVVLTPF